MADLALVTGLTQPDPVFAEIAEIRDALVAETLAAGDALYITTAGKAGLAGANTSGKRNFRGIALDKKRTTGVSSFLKRGYLAGFDLSALSVDVPIYLSDTLGKLSTAAGTTSIIVGRVSMLTSGEKILYIEAPWDVQYA